MFFAFSLHFFSNSTSIILILPSNWMNSDCMVFFVISTASDELELTADVGLTLSLGLAVTSGGEEVFADNGVIVVGGGAIEVADTTLEDCTRLDVAAVRMEGSCREDGAELDGSAGLEVADVEVGSGFWVGVGGEVVVAVAEVEGSEGLLVVDVEEDGLM